MLNKNKLKIDPGVKDTPKTVSADLRAENVVDLRSSQENKNDSAGSNSAPNDADTKTEKSGVVSFFSRWFWKKDKNAEDNVVVQDKTENTEDNVVVQDKAENTGDNVDMHDEKENTFKKKWVEQGGVLVKKLIEVFAKPGADVKEALLEGAKNTFNPMAGELIIRGLDKFLGESSKDKEKKGKDEEDPDKEGNHWVTKIIEGVLESRGLKEYKWLDKTMGAIKDFDTEGGFKEKLSPFLEGGVSAWNLAEALKDPILQILKGGDPESNIFDNIKKAFKFASEQLLKLIGTVKELNQGENRDEAIKSLTGISLAIVFYIISNDPTKTYDEVVWEQIQYPQKSGPEAEKLDSNRKKKISNKQINKYREEVKLYNKRVKDRKDEITDLDCLNKAYKIVATIDSCRDVLMKPSLAASGVVGYYIPTMIVGEYRNFDVLLLKLKDMYKTIDNKYERDTIRRTINVLEAVAPIERNYTFKPIALLKLIGKNEYKSDLLKIEDMIRERDPNRQNSSFLSDLGNTGMSVIPQAIKGMLPMAEKNIINKDKDYKEAFTKDGKNFRKKQRMLQSAYIMNNNFNIKGFFSADDLVTEIYELLDDFGSVKGKVSDFRAHSEGIFESIKDVVKESTNFVRALTLTVEEIEARGIDAGDLNVSPEVPNSNLDSSEVVNGNEESQPSDSLSENNEVTNQNTGKQSWAQVLSIAKKQKDIICSCYEDFKRLEELNRGFEKKPDDEEFKKNIISRYSKAGNQLFKLIANNLATGRGIVSSGKTKMHESSEKLKEKLFEANRKMLDLFNSASSAYTRISKSGNYFPDYVDKGLKTITASMAVLKNVNSKEAKENIKTLKTARSFERKLFKSAVKRAKQTKNKELLRVINSKQFKLILSDKMVSSNFSKLLKNNENVSQRDIQKAITDKTKKASGGPIEVKRNSENDTKAEVNTALENDNGDQIDNEIDLGENITNKKTADIVTHLSGLLQDNESRQIINDMVLCINNVSAIDETIRVLEFLSKLDEFRKNNMEKGWVSNMGPALTLFLKFWSIRNKNKMDEGYVKELITNMAGKYGDLI